MENAIVQVESLVKEFPGEVRTLYGIRLVVEHCIIYGLLGPNGAGKTTLIRVLATLLQPDGGSARVACFDVRRDPDEVRKRIELAGQYAAVDDFPTGRENVEMIGRLYGLPRDEARRRAGEVLERIRLVEAADRPVKTYSLDTNPVGGGNARRTNDEVLAAIVRVVERACDAGLLERDGARSAPFLSSISMGTRLER